MLLIKYFQSFVFLFFEGFGFPLKSTHSFTQKLNSSILGVLGGSMITPAAD
jgi:hypothetical protein